MSERTDARVQREAPNGIVQFQLLREDERYREALYALDRDGVLWMRVLWHGQWGPWGRSDATGHETAGSEAEEREAVRQVTEYSAANTGRIVERIKTAGQERLAAVAPSPETSGDTQGSPPAPEQGQVARGNDGEATEDDHMAAGSSRGAPPSPAPADDAETVRECDKCAGVMTRETRGAYAGMWWCASCSTPATAQERLRSVNRENRRLAARPGCPNATVWSDSAQRCIAREGR